MTDMRRVSRFGVQKRRSSHDVIAKVLGSEILAGVHKAGSKMPPEQELLARFEVSRTVLREVLKTLAAKGLVVSKVRVGTHVLDHIYWNYFDADVLAWKVDLGLDPDFSAALAEVRRAFEPAAARLAADRRTPEEIATLRDCVAQMDRSRLSRQGFAEADLAFHLAVGVASGNPLFRSIAAAIEAALFAAFSLSSPVESPQRHRQVVDAHRAIVDAIEARDGDAAAKAMLATIDAGFERVAASAKRAMRQARHG
jgi:DNA-binding FadR family transcriptional regulator